MSATPTPLFAAVLDALMPLKAQPFPERVTSDEQLVIGAVAFSMQGNCTRRRVGAVVADAHGRIIGSGRNGSPPGYPGCLTDGACPRGRMSLTEVAPGASYTSGAGVCTALHAEKNALLFTDPLARRGGVIAVSDAPCDGCSLDLAGSGLSRVLWPEHDGSSWVIRERLLGHPHPIGGLYDALPAA